MHGSSVPRRGFLVSVASLPLPEFIRWPSSRWIRWCVVSMCCSWHRKASIRRWTAGVSPPADSSPRCSRRCSLFAAESRTNCYTRHTTSSRKQLARHLRRGLSEKGAWTVSGGQVFEVFWESAVCSLIIEHYRVSVAVSGSIEQTEEG